MECSIKHLRPEQYRGGCVVVGVFTPRNLSTAAQALDRAARGHLGKASAAAMNGKLGSHLLLTQVPRIAAQRVLMIGLGRSRDFNDKAYRDACRASVRALNDYGINDAASFLPELPVGKRPLEWRLMHALQAAADTTYRFDQLKSKKTSGTHPLRKLTFGLQDPGGLAQAQLALKRAHALVEGVALAKDLGNLAPNICTPSHLAQQAEALAKRYTMRCEVLERKDMEKLGMGAMLAVAQGSVEPPKMIILHYQGGQPGDAPIALVGKGITFDTGGISLKPAAEMDEMKFDMCGAASVLGTLKAVAQMRLGINVIGIVPATENMPGGRATRPGDVVKTLSGQSVEILNTDAEGRLILCDALSYAQRYKPSAVVDIATLTGACVIALGHVAAGLFANDDALATELTAAGDYAHDRVWRMPLWDDYQEQLRSNFADMANIGGRPAGSVTAACFLSRFAKPLRWAHLDIAGVAWRSGKEKGATGRPVPLLTRFLIERAGTAR